MFSPTMVAILELMRDWFAQVNANFKALEKKIDMNFQQLSEKVDALTAKVTDLQTSAANAGTALANEIQVVNDVIAALRAGASNGITPEQADALAAKLDASTTNLDAVKTAVDAAAVAATDEATNVQNPPAPTP